MQDNVEKERAPHKGKASRNQKKQQNGTCSFLIEFVTPFGSQATLLNSALLAAIACGKSDATVIDIGAGERNGYDDCVVEMPTNLS